MIMLYVWMKRQPSRFRSMWTQKHTYARFVCHNVAIASFVTIACWNVTSRNTKKRIEKLGINYTCQLCAPSFARVSTADDDFLFRTHFHAVAFKLDAYLLMHTLPAVHLSNELSNVQLNNNFELVPAHHHANGCQCCQILHNDAANEINEPSMLVKE